MPYSPSGGAVSKQLPFGMSNLPLDAKLKYDDTVNFTKRAFISTAEILAYFPEDSPFREGNFEILLNTGGSLSNGIITGGIESIWWFSRGTLIQKYYSTLEVDNLISGITPEIPSLQQVTTGTGNNVTANAVQFSGIGNLNLSVDSLIGFGGTGETGFINVVNGQATGAIGFKPLESVFKFQTSAAPADQYSFSLRPEDENTSGALINRRLEFNAGINPTEGVVLSQLDNYQLRTEKGIANGYASLGSNGKIPNNQLPALAISETFVVSSQAAMLALSGAEEGDVAVRTDISESFILTATPASTLSNWQELLTPTAPVQSVNGQVGNVNLTTTNIPEGTNLYYLDARVSANSDVVLNSALRHAAVSLGATNGLSLSGQQLSLGLSSGSSTGSLSSTDWTTFNNKQPAGNYALVSQIPTPNNYITNGTSLQTSSNFYISGNGRMNTLTLSTSPVDKVGTTAEILVRNATTGAIEKLNGDNSTYVRGNGILAGFESAVRSTFLNGMVAGTNTPIVTSNSVIVALANLQAQITSRVDITGSYPNPVWLTSLAYSKLTGVPTIPVDANLLHTTGNETKNGNLSLVSNEYITTDTITFIGDSITDGAPGPSSISKRYSTLTAGWVGLTEVNHGIGSSTMQKGTPVNPIGGVNMQDRFGDIPTKSSNNRVLVFEFGANDFGYNGGDYTPSNYKTAYRATLNNAISKGWETKDIYLLSPPYINATGFAFYSSINGGNTPSLSRLTAYISATLEIAQEFNTNYLDLYSCMTNNGGDTLLSSDGVHPNDMGCRVISLFLSDQINRNFSPLYIYDDNNSTIGYFSNKGGLSNLKIGGVNEQSLISPPSIELGGSYSTNANDFNNAKLKLCITGGGVWGLGVSASAGLEYFSATNKHTFYGNLDLKNQVNCEGNIFGLQFISSGMNAAYNYLDRSNSAKSWSMFADNSYTRWRSGVAPLVDLMILQETTGVLSVKGAPVGLTDVVRLNELSTYAPLGSPSLTGTPTAPTAPAGTSTNQLATTGFVTSNFVDKTTNQTSGLTGDKIWDGYHEFRQSVVVGPLVNSTTYSNISIGTQTAILTFPAGNGVLGYRPIVNTSLNTIQTSASLNTEYPTAAIGQHVTAPNVGTGMKYEKINTTGGGTWMSWAASTI